MSDAVINRTANTEYPVLDILANRWSPRAFEQSSTIDDDALFSALEAARWSPSASNGQPWRFIITRHGSEAFTKIVSTLIDFNKMWAPNAPILMLAVAETSDSAGVPSTTATYDLGQSVAHFSVQAHSKGLYVHQMSGFDPELASQIFDLPESFTVVTAIAVGKLGEAADLPDGLRDAEHKPRERRPLAESIIVND